MLLPFQRRYALDASRFKIALWSRQTGKGFTSSYEAAADAMTTAKSNWIIAAPTERQACETLEKCKDWARAAAVAVSESEEELEAAEKGLGIKAKVIQFPNGSKIYALPGRPASLRGFTGSLILDEFAFFEDQEAVWKAVYAVITNPMSGIKRVRITSTPKGKGDMFHRLVEDNLLTPKAGRKIEWQVHKTTIHEAARDWEAAGMLRGKSAEAYVEEIRAGFDTPEAWPQEFECDFLDGDNFLLPYDVIALAESAEASCYADPAVFLPVAGRSLFCGIDFGRTNDPTVCWTLERQGDVLWTREVLVLKGMAAPDQEAALAPRIAAARRISFDYTGPGVGTGDGLARTFGRYDPAAHLFGKVELCTFTAPFKRDIFPKLRRMFEAPVKLRIPATHEIREDLHAMRQIVNAGQYTYSAPRTAEGHSDRCTALALAVRAASGPVADFAPTPFNFSRREYRYGD